MATSAVAVALGVRVVFALAWVASFLVAAEWVLRRRRGSVLLLATVWFAWELHYLRQHVDGSGAD